MTTTPPRPNARSRLGKAAGVGGVALSALVALAVAATFLVLTGAHRGGWGDARLRATPPASIPAKCPAAALPTERGHVVAETETCELDKVQHCDGLATHAVRLSRHCGSESIGPFARSGNSR